MNLPVLPAPDAFPAESCGSGIEYRGNVFHVECYDPDGHLKWVDDAWNGVASVGLDITLNTLFRATTQPTAWYVGLVDNAGWTGYNAADTMASHSSPNAWAENTQYSNSTRPQWSPGAPSGNAIVNAATMNFAMTATATIHGLFVCTDNTVGGVTGTIFATASFVGGNQGVGPGDTLKVTYTVSAANASGNI